MEEISLTELRARFEQVCREVEAGKEYLVTRRGSAVVKLVPIAKDPEEDPGPADPT